MFEIYEKKKPDYLNYAAIGGAIVSYFVTMFFVIYLELNEICLFASMLVAVFVHNAIINSDHRRRITDGE